MRLEPLVAHHAEELYDEIAGERHDALWTYSASARPVDGAGFADYVRARADDPSLVTLAVVPVSTQRPSGLASWMRDDPAHGSVEIGGIVLGSALQRTTAATEALFLMVDHAFGRGYRRLEWKCDSLNGSSRTAALRLGFRFEGVFRQAVVYKNRSRDTAWFSITDLDWRLLAPAFRTWLHPSNFEDPSTAVGQRRALSTLTHQALPGD